MSVTDYLNLNCGCFSSQNHSGTSISCFAFETQLFFCALLGIVASITRWSLFSPLSDRMFIHRGEFPEFGDSPAAGCTEPGWVLCFGLGTKEIDNWPAVATAKLPAQCQGLFSFSFCPHSVSGHEDGRCTSGTADPTWPKDFPYQFCHGQQQELRE